MILAEWLDGTNMIYSYEKLYSIAQSYCRENNLQLEQKLGHGTQGIVYSTNRNSALKIHAELQAYKRERDVYLRLAEHRAHKINALIIPQLLKYDDSFLALEMTLVAPPFMVDFGGAYLDRAPAHMLDPQVVGEWLEEKKE